MKRCFPVLAMSALIGLAGCGAPQKSVEPALPQAPANQVRLTPEAVQKSGIQRVTVESRENITQIQTIGEIKADINRTFHISSIVAGRVVRDNANLGDVIRQGQVVAVIQNQDVVKAQAASIHELHNNQLAIRQAQTRLALARENFQREKQLYAQGITPRKDYLQSETEWRLAQSEWLGLQEHATHIRSEAKALLETYGVNFHGESERLTTGSPLIAPRSGVVTQKNIALGDAVAADQLLYEVADLSRLWLDMAIYPQDLASVRVGQKIAFTSDSRPGQRFQGRINFIQSNASPTSQTYTVRAFLDNASGQLKPGMFGEAVIERDQAERLPFVPEVAVQTEGKQAYVFVPVGASGQYRKQPVMLGDKRGGGYFVKQGLEPGQQVVGNGSFTLKAELLKNSLGGEE